MASLVKYTFHHSIVLIPTPDRRPTRSKAAPCARSFWKHRWETGVGQSCVLLGPEIFAMVTKGDMPWTAVLGACPLRDWARFRLRSGSWRYTAYTPVICHGDFQPRARPGKDAQGRICKPGCPDFFAREVWEDGESAMLLEEGEGNGGGEERAGKKTYNLGTGLCICFWGLGRR
eukprot:1228328-Amorphochlora_amoeboformis.AAC.1